ncbi:host specificity factor TipJ family phage tail protein [Paramagnetospirillum magneticum]|uniref:Phage-related protein n=1 Tax=Paramagnetospirillum magneticum (strain ATCC 700264 / AMB-1) TaxID=342108 RepID=Q2W829_PARM1|nr:host specificity factor TipJ family phage tail protein [Paramagnetospirillum magneticum]BAE49996.1 Phage-related protein [Paramagnetospirillum magneticum AMB-1]
MTASIVIVTNPFEPVASRSVHAVEAGITVGGLLQGCGIAEDCWSDGPEILIGGMTVPVGIYAVRAISDSEVVTVIRWPQGGGGDGGGGKNPMRIVLTIAVMVAAIYLGPMAAVAMGYTAAGSAAAMATAGIALAGSMLINTVIPAPKPSMPSLNWGGSGSAPAPSPTYSIQAQGNQGRLGQPIPVIYGRHLIYPDLASEPYQDYVGGEQYLYQLHVIGQGEYAVEQIRIEDTPISSFEEVQTETVPPGSRVTLFEPDVVTAAEVAGQELVAPNLVQSGDDGYIGPFTANPVDTTAGALGIDVVMPRGLYYANDGGSLDSRSVQWQVEARAIDAEGGAIGGWVVLAQPSHSAATNSALRLSFRYSVSPGRYEVRLKRLDTKDTAERAGHEIRWGALRAYLTGQPDFGAVTLLAVKMRATDNLSQRSSRMINVIATRKLPVWSAAGGWSAPQPTRSIAWAFADACKADYGAKLADSRIDLKTLTTLDAVWAARGDFFDAVFDTSMTVWEALTRIARCGRAVPIQQGGIVRIIRDAPQTMPVAMFGPRNIVKGSFKIKYVMPGDDTADAVTVEYFSSRTWKPDETTAKLADSAGDNPAKVNLFGCTAKDHAQREGLYIAANNRYRRRMVTFRTELEGMIPTYGDLVAITHDMPRWGQGGEVIDWRAESAKLPWVGAVLVLSEPLTWTEGATHYLALRRRDGSLAGPFRVEPMADAPTMVRLAEPLTVTPYTGGSEERTYFSFGSGQAWAQTARILAIRPRAEQVEITAVAEDFRVHVN